MDIREGGRHRRFLSLTLLITISLHPVRGYRPTSKQELSDEGYHMYKQRVSIPGLIDHVEALDIIGVASLPSESASEPVSLWPGKWSLERNTSDPLIEFVQHNGIYEDTAYSPVSLGHGDQWHTEGPRHGLTLDNERGAPAIKGVATHEFFEYASHVAVELMKKNFPKVSLPPLETYVDVGVLGTFRLNLDNIALDDLDINSTHSGIFLGDNGTLVLTVTDLDAVVNGDFHFQRTSGFPPVPFGGGGHITIRATKGRAVFEVLVVNHGDGRAFIMARAPARVTFEAIRVEISNVPLKFLFNFIAAIAASPIQAAITQQVANQVTVRVPEAGNRLLAGIPTVVQLGDLNLNISLASMPLVTRDNVTLYDWGRFQDPDPAHPQDCPFRLQPSAVSPPRTGGEGRMLVADVDESLANCLTWALFQRGDLDRYVEGEGLPGLALYTDTWAAVVPGLAKKYPHQWMGLQVHIPEPPMSHIKADVGVTTHGNATLSFYLVQPKPLKTRQKGQTLAQQSSEPYQEGRDPKQQSPGTLQEKRQRQVGERREGQREVGEGGEKGQRQVGERGEKGQREAGEGRERGQRQVGERGEHLFTLDLAAQLVANNVKFVPASAQLNDTFRLSVDMHIVEGSLWHQVVDSSVGPINESGLQLLISLVGFLVEREVNGDILAHLVLPDVAHIKLVDPIVGVGDGFVQVVADVKYVDT